MKQSHLPQQIDITKVYQQKLPSGLYIVSTPIGNIFDITIRAITTLAQSEYIFAEDTRVSKKLLNFYGIATPLISCNEHIELKSEIQEKCLQGNVVSLISDAGTPLISDPGYKLVNWCIEHGIQVYPIPGPCSAICSLSVSGLPSDRFLFVGFLPSKSHARLANLKELSTTRNSMIFFEAPHRLIAFLQDSLNVFGNREIFIGRELTKLFEEHFRGTIEDAIDHFSNNDPIGEFAIVIAGANAHESQESIKDLLHHYMQSMTLKDAVFAVADATRMPKKEVYQKALEIKNEHRS